VPFLSAKRLRTETARQGVSPLQRARQPFRFTIALHPQVLEAHITLGGCPHFLTDADFGDLRATQVEGRSTLTTMPLCCASARPAEPWRIGSGKALRGLAIRRCEDRWPSGRGALRLWWRGSSRNVLLRTICNKEEKPMNKVLIGLAVSVLTAGSAVASDKADIMAILKQWISGAAGTVATCEDDAAVIDDIPPFEWHGPGACSRWQKDNDAYTQQEGTTDATFAMGTPQQLIISKDHAYAVLPTTFAATQGGKRVRETATSTVVLHKTATGWRIAAWTWATQTVQ
jgi:hypothetical protein